MTVTIKTESTNEANISNRTVTYDLYVDGEYKATYNDVLKAMEAKERLMAN